MNCPHCQTVNPAGAQFCLNCGKELGQKCGNCQAELAPDASFCMYCGHPVRVASADDDERLSRLAASAPKPLAEKVRASSDISGERRVVTVLFVDVVGSTVLAEQLDVENWSAIMNGAFERITPAIYRYEGTIARLMGDSLVAFFGAPVAHEDDPMRAVNAALDVLDLAKTYAQEVRDIYGIDFAMRACLSNGPVVIENINRDLKYEYTPLGGVVNLAARIKFAAEPMTALITEDVYRYVEPQYNFSDQGYVEVRNREKPVRVYRVLSRKEAPGSLRGIAGLESPMVGRENELSRLMGLCTAVQAGLGRAVVILGEPGLGKSRLVSEWQAAIAEEHTGIAPQWAEGRCLSYGGGLAYHLLQNLLRSLLGVSGASSEAETHQALIGLLTDLFQGEAGVLPANVYPYLAHLLSLRLEGDALEILQRTDPQALQVHYVDALRSIVEALTSRRSLVLILEDLHWADPSSVDVLSKLLPLARTQALLFCLVTRPERDMPGWRLIEDAREILGSSLTEISIDSLSESDSRQLVANLLEIEALEEDMRSLILRRAEGNPFFVEEVIRMLIEQSAIIPKNGGWAASAKINEIQIPNNLQGLLMARIDRLPDEDRHSLRVASVVGRQFPVRVLEYVLADGVGAISGNKSIRNRLSSLEAAGLVNIAQLIPDLEYQFRHSLVQDATYGSLLATDRKKLHLAVGEAVEALYPDRIDEYAAMLAWHFGAAGIEDRSTKYCILAGDAALASFANQEAEGHYRCALDYCVTDQQRGDLLTKLGEALFAQSRFQDAIETWKEGIVIYQYLENQDGVAHTYARAARAAWHTGEIPEGLDLALEGLSLVGDMPSSKGKASLLHEVGRAYYFNGQPDNAEIYCKDALEMAEEWAAVDVQADTMATLGVLPGIEPEVAAAYLGKAIDLGENQGFLTIAARAHHNLSTILIGNLYDYVSARQHLLRAAEIHRERGNVQREIFSYVSAVGLSFEIGDFELGKQSLDRIEALLEVLPDPESVELEVGTTKTALMAFGGQWDESLKMLREYQQKARQRGDLQMLNNIDTMLAFILVEIDRLDTPQDLEEAVTAAQEAIEIADRGLSNRVGAQGLLGVVYTRMGDYEQAARILEDAEALADPASPIDKRSLLDLKAEIALSQRNWDRAIELLDELAGEEAQMGRRWMWARALITLADAHVSRGEAQDFGRAQEYYRQAQSAFTEMEVEGYTRIIERRMNALEDKTLSTLLASHKVARELTQAGIIQSSFLPEDVPTISGWSLSAVLEPARETSGDYYDFIELPGNRLGILVADVTDKGAGAALFMVSSRTLIRTFADQFPDQPEQVIQATNNRLVMDTHDGLYVTLFYGIIDLDKGSLAYCNAGHNPPYLLKTGPENEVIELPPTGMTMGILESETWERGEVSLSNGDALVLYTDGVTDAQNERGEFFDEKRLIESGKSAISDETLSAEDIRNIILKDIHNFIGPAERVDDLTLLVLRKNR